jgi:hypothetical protein
VRENGSSADSPMVNRRRLGGHRSARPCPGSLRVLTEPVANLARPAPEMLGVRASGFATAEDRLLPKWEHAIL